jgi:hypothetical protein
MFRDVLTKYPLVANNASQRSDILYPQVRILPFCISCSVMGMCW